jgi:hypothetical protein
VGRSWCPTSGRQGQPFRYRLLYAGEGESGVRFVAGLKSIEQLRQEARQLGLADSDTPSRPESELCAEKRHFVGASRNGRHEGQNPANDGTPRKSEPNPLTSRVPGKNHVPANG